MSAISIDDVKKLARLSALSITDDQAASLTSEIEEIITYVKHLDEVDTDGVEPTYQVNDLHTVVREDVKIDYGVSKEKLLENTPHVRDGQIEVRKVL